MSNGVPALMATGRLEQVGKTKNKPRLVAHAEGCGPFDEVADWRPIQIALSGGDDFCEPLSIRDMRNALEAARAQIVVVSNLTHYRIHPDAHFDDAAAELDTESASSESP